MELYQVALTTLMNFPKRITLTLVEMQQLPEIERADSRNEISILNWTIYNRRRKVCVSFKTDMDQFNLVFFRYRNKTYVKDTELELKSTEFEKKIYLNELIF